MQPTEPADTCILIHTGYLQKQCHGVQRTRVLGSTLFSVHSHTALERACPPFGTLTPTSGIF